MHAHEAIRLIRRQADRLRTLDATDSRQPVFRRWFRETKAVLDEAFGADTPSGAHREFQDVLFQPLRPSKVDPDSDWRQAYEKGVSVVFAFLDSVVEDLTAHPDHASGAAPEEKAPESRASSATPASAASGKPSAKTGAGSGTGRRSCLVVGKDEDACADVVRFLDKIGSHAVALGELPGGAASLLDRLDEHKDAAFAVMIVAAGEPAVGASGKRSGKSSPGSERNPSLELGILIGRLGLQNLCMLYREGAETPPSSEGIACVALDARGAWRFDLARAMKGAGLPVDLNNAV